MSFGKRGLGQLWQKEDWCMMNSFDISPSDIADIASLLLAFDSSIMSSVTWKENRKLCPWNALLFLCNNSLVFQNCIW